MAPVMWRFFWRGRFFLESDNAPLLVHLNHAKLLRRLLRGNLNRRDGDVRAGIDMLLQHAAVIHFVDVIARQNEDVLRALAADRINILINRVRRTLIPLLRNAHLRRQYLDVIAKPGQRRPARANVPVQAQRFVLGQNEDAPQIRIDAIGKRDVDDAIQPAERHRRLRPIARQRPQSFALPSGQEYPNGILHVGHSRPPQRTAMARHILTTEWSENTNGSQSASWRRPDSDLSPIQWITITLTEA